MNGLQGEKSRVAESLFAALGRVLLRSQFGGQGVWCDGVMFALIAEGELYLRARDAQGRHCEDCGMQPFIYTKRGFPVRLGYYRVEAAIWQQPQRLATLLRRSLQQARSDNDIRLAAMRRLHTRPNISINMERRLYRIGIRSLADLERVGATQAFSQLKEANHQVDDRVLFDLAAAVQGCHSAVLPRPVSEALRQWLLGNAHRWRYKK
ncbi:MULTISPECIES: TfoX/Sxy family protein [Edwardsiella]|uniref:DNA transformation protein TfoX n=2 Tax=Edwardsiella anguillarum TaxID=1821960 RepID=A0A076LP47_9GAMM|nr:MULTISPECIES: TfoX/Sxy family protein [Edwardsiella]AIJ09651.1 DNA transformation protein TfoX [Edwardsiella anguillarum ET080813]AKR77392.1 TfoX/Sxy family DNA transformation protein [Edwardsiella sp. LADL05-105]KAB0592616.1 TfoX/Sxy family DNA transformation protein [Edwardsiella anguillarum]UOU80433.1 TfoX/Sxy family DNA transformation protein [Edwardsiella anguillarum]WHP85122.1 TfoX/Sxy family DNA transformation protein [Edwardsiella anguillarum]